MSFFLFFSLISTFTNASPHHQRGNRHGHSVNPVIQTTTTPPTIVVQSATGGGAAVNTITSTGDTNPSTIPTNSYPTAASSDAPIISDTPSTGNGGGKRGLAYNSSSPSLTVFSNSDITWIHDWDSSPGDAPSSFTFVPTLWSDKSPHSDNWNQNAAGHQYLMSFNEPDIVAQANMEVGYAVDKFKSLMFPLRSSSVKIGTPSVSSGSGNNEAGIPMGTGWLSQFLSQCNDDNTCQADFVSGHWYGCPSGTCTVQDDITSFNAYVNDLVSTADGRDVWVSEFQRYGDEAGQKQFLQSVLPTLDGNSAPNDLGTTFAG
ncbi:MAG: hypothetical protein Q9170_005168 [Blastenia crenularia]